ncbi:MAG: hypothetical protein E6J42_09185 [Chloroflexi bacterium]|nr:MAG: hypothetical protein E6J42_09185 [Chloroflexota bacterium]
MTDQDRMKDEPRLKEEDLFAGADPRIFVTDPDNTEEGRTFVWALTRWFERLEGEETGAVEFSPVAEDEDELREWLSAQQLEMTELDDEYAREVRDEFLNQTPLYPEAPELSVQEPSPAD